MKSIPVGASRKDKTEIIAAWLQRERVCVVIWMSENESNRYEIEQMHN